MREHTQLITACPRRGDGRNASGIPGDCLRTAVASMMGVPDLLSVPHFAVHVDWWSFMRRWARAQGGDFACLVPVDGSIRQFITSDDDEWAGLVVASGPSPRGPFWHSVVVDLDLNLVWDPHPSRAGIVSVVDTFVHIEQPYDPPPEQRSIAAAPHRSSQVAAVIGAIDRGELDASPEALMHLRSVLARSR